MQVKCVLCDTIENIEDNSLKAKRLRNRRIYMYLCKNCHERVKKNTMKRHETGNFKMYKEKKKEDEYL